MTVPSMTRAPIRLALLAFLSLARPLSPSLALSLAAQDAPFGQCTTGPPETTVEVALRSLHIPMEDGTRIAADLLLPKRQRPDVRLPTVLTATRYWRAQEGAPASPGELFWVRNGYAVVSTDVRGTGASFGVWLYPWSRTEVRDLGDVVRWIAAQPWSDGRVGTIGTSYTANTAQLAAVSNDPAVKAVIPRFMDFDVWSDLASPGGVQNEFLLREWGQAVHAMDMNEKTGQPPRGVRPVDDDRDGSLLRAAVRDHRRNPKLHEVALDGVFRDDSIPAWEATMDVVSTHNYRDEIERSGVPIFGWASWLDAGTSNGVISRFLTWSNPQYVVIGPWSHGGGYHASPFQPADRPTTPNDREQNRAALCFFDQHLKGRANGMDGPRIFYYTLGEEAWKSATTWPPTGTTTQRWYFSVEHALSRTAPTSPGASDRYTVDFEATTGTQNRWYTQMGGGDVIYPDRAPEDRRLLTYTSAPLDADLEVTGNPIVTLQLASTSTDGNFFVYLEDVAPPPDGRVIYVTEGQLRGIHRKVSSDPPYRVLYPYHSLRKADAAPLVPGEMTTLTFGLIPTSVVFKRGHRIRVALAGADKDTFARLPKDEIPVWTVSRSRASASFIELPVVAPGDVRSGT